MSSSSLRAFYKGKPVLVTGHTGFKGSWLCLWLETLGARVAGFALAPEKGRPSLFEQAGLARSMDSNLADIRDEAALTRAFRKHKPELVFHLAAQALVRRSYREPAETFSVNVQGTAALLDAARACPSVKQLVVATSDKVYRDPGRHPCREDDPLGGRDPYSASKAAAEHVAASYRAAFFSKGPALATVRAGNVIGGGDWAEDRIVPDIVRALEAGRPVVVRNPKALRPWQHVLEPLSGYLSLAAKLGKNPKAFAEAWNFGPDEREPLAVLELVDSALALWGSGSRKVEAEAGAPYEAPALRLDSSKARERLGWRPVYAAREAVALTMDWYRRVQDGADARALTLDQLAAYEGASIKLPS